MAIEALVALTPRDAPATHSVAAARGDRHGRATVKRRLEEHRSRRAYGLRAENLAMLETIRAARATTVKLHDFRAVFAANESRVKKGNTKFAKRIDEDREVVSTALDPARDTAICQLINPFSCSELWRVRAIICKYAQEYIATFKDRDGCILASNTKSSGGATRPPTARLRKKKGHEMSETIKTIGFIGLGSMGGDQARELTKLNLPLILYDASSAALQRFEGRAKLARGIAEIGASSDSVGICVQNDEQVLACVEPLVTTMRPGSVLLIHSTVKPETVSAIADRMAENGVATLDAPVTRTEMTKDGPFVFCMVGGDEAIMLRIKPVLDAFSTDTMHVGPLGSAMAMKICNNLVSWGEILLGLEAIEIAQAAGVPLDKLMTVMNRNGVMSPPMRGFIDFYRDRGDTVMRDFIRVQAGIGEKDLKLAEQLGGQVGHRVRISSHLRSLVKPAILEICDR